jgi:hypothetical protein
VIHGRDNQVRGSYAVSPKPTQATP